MRNVLVVDDEHIIADTLAVILSQHGFRASAVYNGQSAIESVQQNPPDILITDVNMPGMSGIELAIAARERWPTCQILLFSGHAATVHLLDETRQRGYDFHLLSKPVHPKDLLRMLSAPRNAISSAG